MPEKEPAIFGSVTINGIEHEVTVNDVVNRMRENASGTSKLIDECYMIDHMAPGFSSIDFHPAAAAESAGLEEAASIEPISAPPIMFDNEHHANIHQGRYYAISPEVFSESPDMAVNAADTQSGETLPLLLASSPDLVDGADLEHVEFAALDDGRESFEAWLIRGESGSYATIHDLVNASYVVAAIVQTITAIADEFIASSGADESMPKVDTAKPRKHVYSLSKVFTKGIEKALENGPGEPTYVQVSPRGQKPVYSLLSLGYDMEGVTVGKDITPFDMAVYSSVWSHCEAGNQVMTAAQVSATMTGKEKPSNTIVQAVADCMMNLTNIPVELDFTDEMRGREMMFDGKIEKAKDCHFRTRMLQASIVHAVSANGTVVDAFHVLEPPVFYRHAKMVGQITTVSQRVIEITGKRIQATERNITIRDYLITRIAPMKKKHSRVSKTIVYKSMIEKVNGGPCETRVQRRRMIETACKILDAFVEAEYISGWHECNRSGSSHERYGVEIAV